jgi:hypothetical protein
MAFAVEYERVVCLVLVVRDRQIRAAFTEHFYDFSALRYFAGEFKLFASETLTPFPNRFPLLAVGNT